MLTHSAAASASRDAASPAPITAEEVLAMMRTSQWVADRDAILTLAALRGLAAPRFYSPLGYSLTGLMVWHDSPSSATPPDALADLFDDWYGDRRVHDEQVTVRVWQIVLYGLAHDYLLPAMNAIHYRLAFHPNKGAENPVRATVPRPHHSDPISYSTIVHISWPEMIARLVATINAIEHAPPSPSPHPSASVH